MILGNKYEVFLSNPCAKIFFLITHSPAAYGAEECVVERVEQIVDHQVYEVEMEAENPPGS